MPHVDELHPARAAVLGLALAAALLAGCTETQRKVPLLAIPGAPVVAQADVASPRLLASPAQGAGEPASASDAAAPATTGVSIGASRRT